MGVFPMKKLNVILAVLFTLATTGQAFAFDPSFETSAQAYFAIPFGATSKADATPRFGLSVDYGNRSSDNSAAYGLQRINSFDLRLSIAGDASIYSNGVNLGDRLNALYAADSNDLAEGWIVPLSLIGVGIAMLAVAKGAN